MADLVDLPEVQTASHRTRSGILVPRPDQGVRVTMLLTDVPGLSIVLYEDPGDWARRWIEWEQSDEPAIESMDPVKGEPCWLLRPALNHVLAVVTGFVQQARPKDLDRLS